MERNIISYLLVTYIMKVIFHIRIRFTYILQYSNDNRELTKKVTGSELNVNHHRTLPVSLSQCNCELIIFSLHGGLIGNTEKPVEN